MGVGRTPSQNREHVHDRRYTEQKPDVQGPNTFNVQYPV